MILVWCSLVFIVFKREMLGGRQLATRGRPGTQTARHLQVRAGFAGQVPKQSVVSSDKKLTIQKSLLYVISGTNHQSYRLFLNIYGKCLTSLECVSLLFSVCVETCSAVTAWRLLSRASWPAASLPGPRHVRSVNTGTAASQHHDIVTLLS